jgi:LPXTG-site transpeptidase (sortase) family protein
MASRRSSSGSSSGGCTRWIVGLAFVVGVFVAFSLYQSSRPASIPATPRITPARPSPVVRVTGTQPPPSPAPRPVALKISAEKAGLLTSIIELYYSKSSDGWDLSLLNQFAGHVQGTSGLGRGGNYVLAGHVELKDGSVGPFARVHLLKAGDLITILSDDPKKPVVMRYAVTGVKVVEPNALNEIRNHGYEELTLVTCQDWDAQAQMYDKRVVVHARPLPASK